MKSTKFYRSLAKQLEEERLERQAKKTRQRLMFANLAADVIYARFDVKKVLDRYNIR